MIHNHVTELRDIFNTYAATIWPILKDSPQERDMSSKIKIVGDYPQLQLLEALRDYSADKPLRAILSLIDHGNIVHRTANMGTYKSDNTIRVGLNLTTADPELREELGGQMMEFIGKNKALFHGTKSRWWVDSFSSGGVSPTSPDLYGRTYYMWVKEVS